MTSDTNDNRRLTWNAAGSGGGGEDDKTLKKIQNSR